MNNFKSGVSDDDPLASDGDDSDSSSQETSTSSDALGSTETESGTSTSRSAPTGDPLRTEMSDLDGLPWIHQRSSISDGRERTVQHHLQQTTLDREHEAQSDVPLDERPDKADLREAAYLVGLSHLNEVADVLRSWGYDYE